MSVESLGPAQARAGHRLLLQYLVTCPGCGNPGAAHADDDGSGALALVRFVCPQACSIAASEVLSLLPAGVPAEVALTGL